MKIEVGQWFRTPYNGRFVQAQKVNNTEVCYDNVYYCLKENISKATSTPQELIQVGDLIIREGFGVGLVEIMDRRDLRIILETCQDITKILTPNEDKSVYTEQWSKDE